MIWLEKKVRFNYWRQHVMSKSNIFGYGSKKGAQKSLLGKGKIDQNLRSLGLFLLTHSHLAGCSPRMLVRYALGWGQQTARAITSAGFDFEIIYVLGDVATSSGNLVSS